MQKAWESGARMPHVSFFGFGLLEAWSFCMLFDRSGEALLGSIGLDAGLPQSLMPYLASLTVAVGSLVYAMVARSGDERLPRRALSAASSALCAIGTALVLYGDFQMQVAGFVVTGIGNAWLWVSWGGVFSAFDTEGTEQVAISSAALEIATVALLCMLPQWAMSAALVALPVVSSSMYVVSLRRIGEFPSRVGREWSFHTPIAFGRAHGVRFVLGIGVPEVITYYLLDSDIPLPVTHAGLDMQLVAGLLAFAVALIGFFRFAPDLSIRSICRVECGVLVASVALSQVWSGSLSRTLVLSQTLLCQYLMLAYAARMVGQGFGNTVYTYGIAHFVNHLSGLVGVLASILIHGPHASPLESVTSMLAIVASLFFLTMYIDSNAGTGGEPPAADRPDEQEDGDVGKRVAEIALAYGLTDRETEIVALLVKGRSAPFIRDELVISLNTVYSHIKHIYAKVGVHGRQELINVVDGRDGS